MEPNPGTSSSLNEQNANQERDLPDSENCVVRDVEKTTETVQPNGTDSTSHVNSASDSSEHGEAEEEEQGNNSELLIESDESLSSDSEEMECLDDRIIRLIIYVNSWHEELLMEMGEDDDYDTGIDSGDDSTDNED